MTRGSETQHGRAESARVLADCEAGLRAAFPEIRWVFERRSACSAVHHKRLRCENELGFKMVKWIAAIELVHRYADLGAGEGGDSEDHEFYGYRVPI
jgi:hypothetical protein